MMSEHEEEREGSTGYRRLKGHQSLQEILRTAMLFEHSAWQFYDSLRDRVGKPLRELVQDLVEEEQRHYHLFESLSRSADVHTHINDMIRTPPSDHRFSDFIQVPDLGELPDDQSILQYAMGREQAAMEQYGTLARETPPGPIRDLFQYLAQEELRHKGDLEKRYYAMVYPTNV